MTAFIEVAIEGGGRSVFDARLIERIDTGPDMGPSDTASKDKPLTIYLRGGTVVKGFGLSLAAIVTAMGDHGMLGGITALSPDDWTL